MDFSEPVHADPHPGMIQCARRALPLEPIPSFRSYSVCGRRIACYSERVPMESPDKEKAAEGMP